MFMERFLDDFGFRNTAASLAPAAFILLLFSCLEAASGNRTFLYAEEIRGLSELPMTELIRIKSSFRGKEGRSN